MASYKLELETLVARHYHLEQVYSNRVRLHASPELIKQAKQERDKAELEYLKAVYRVIGLPESGWNLPDQESEKPNA